MKTSSLLFLLSAAACSPGYAVIPVEEGVTDDTGGALPDDGGTAGDTGLGDTGTDTGTDGGTTEPDYSEWDGATLVVLSPASGAFLPYGEDASFEAVVYDASGEPTDFDAITWSSDLDEGWLREGAAFTDDALDVGTHALTATAQLPNGDRLAYTIGGVLVQSAFAGTYTGEVNIDGAYTTYAVGCSGPAILYIDAYGDKAWGDASCLISLLGYDLDMVFEFDMELEDEGLIGSASIDFSGWFSLPFDMDATVSDEGAIHSEFELDYGDLTAWGGMDLERFSRELPED